MRNIFSSGRKYSVGGNSVVSGISTSGSIVINGYKVRSNGESVSVVNGKVFVDGKELDESETGQIGTVVNITIYGNVGEIDSAAGDVTVHGDVTGNAKTEAGDVTVDGNVGGNVKTEAGSIRIGGSVTGNVKTEAGNITHH